MEAASQRGKADDLKARLDSLKAATKVKMVLISLAHYLFALVYMHRVHMYPNSASCQYKAKVCQEDTTLDRMD